MCLAIPGKIIELSGDKAIADFGSIRRKIDISLLEDCQLNDYVLVHAGFAIQKVSQSVARETYRLLSEMEEKDEDEDIKKDACE